MSDLSKSGPGRRLRWWTATGLVVASMVGTGVFTTTGYLARDLPSPAAILGVWVLSGALALFGALAYAELVVAMPRNGGEYQLLGALVHPALGFVAGVISLAMGFAAPIAASSLLFGAYLARVLPGTPPRAAALTLIAAATIVHARRVEVGAGAQNAATLGKVALVAGLGLAGLALGEPGRLVERSTTPPGPGGTLPAFAVGLVYVSYAYSGWNAAAYVAGEVQDPTRNLPRALGVGTVLVTILYLLLNAAYLASAPLADLAGVDEVAHAAARARFGDGGARLVSAVIAFGLVSSVGALVMTGPRVAAAIGEDYPRLGWLARRSADGAPVPALLAQAAAATGLVVISGVEELIALVGLTLTLFAALTVGGVFLLRARSDGAEAPEVRTWGHPFTSLAFLGLTGWMIVHTVLARPWTAAWGLGAVAVGLGVYRWARGTPGGDSTRSG